MQVDIKKKGYRMLKSHREERSWSRGDGESSIARLKLSQEEIWLCWGRIRSKLQRDQVKGIGFEEVVIPQLNSISGQPEISHHLFKASFYSSAAVERKEMDDGGQHCGRKEQRKLLLAAIVPITQGYQA